MDEHNQQVENNVFKRIQTGLSKFKQRLKSKYSRLQVDEKP